MADVLSIVRAKIVEIKPKLEASQARSDTIHKAVSAAQCCPLGDLVRRAKLTGNDMNEARVKTLEMLLECPFIDDDLQKLLRHFEPPPHEDTRTNKKEGKHNHKRTSLSIST